MNLQLLTLAAALTLPAAPALARANDTNAADATSSPRSGESRLPWAQPTVNAAQTPEPRSGASPAPTTTPPPTNTPASPPPSTDSTPQTLDPKPQPPAPTLDDLLGLTPEAAKDKPKPTDTTTNPDLDKLLTAQEIGDAFEQAIALMNDAAKRLDTSQDPGLDTQRVQETIVRKLDQLLASLDQQQQQQQQQQQSQSKPEKSEQSKSQAQSKPKEDMSQKSGQGENMGDVLSPELREGKLNPQLDAAKAAWGSLPARVRDMLLQGAGDRFSGRYRQLTEDYYKRLAEEASR